MKKNYFILFVLIFWLTSFTFGQEKKHNNIIVFDITGSMVGKPLPYESINKDIWSPSINLLKKQLNSFPHGEKITLYLFGINLIKVGDFSTNVGNTVTSIIINKVDSIRNNNLTQSYTCIYKSLDEIINELDSTYTNTIYLFTDGRNSNGYAPCGDLTPLQLATNWRNSTLENEYLYIFKLKDFTLHPDLDGETIEVIEDALNNLRIFIEPINTTIRISKNNTNSSQQFRITGAGFEYLPSDLILHTNVIDLNSNSDTERAITNPATFSVNKLVQNFRIEPYNEIENIKPGIYKGEISYSFDNSTKNKKISMNDMNLTISIKDIKTEVLFNNKNEEPKATIEFID